MSLNKTVSMDLSTQSINQAIREVKQYKQQLVNFCNALMRRLVEDGRVVAQMNVMSMNAVYTGQLEDSIQGVFFPEKKLGVIFTNVPYALFVEFGTGIVGAEGPQHPMKGEVGWEHDVNNHGNKGWVYYLKTDGVNEFRWTKGMPSRPFMYETLRWLEQNAPKIASEVAANA